MDVKKIPLLARVLIAIAAGIAFGFILPEWAIRVFVTINSIFGNFLGFIIPLIILGLVAPGIADLGKRAGKLLLITCALAYGFTLFTGFFAFFTCDAIYPSLFGGVERLALDGTAEGASAIYPYFKVEIPPLMGVMTSLIAAFTLGLGMSVTKGAHIKNAMDEFREIIVKVINSVIIPLLPLYIFGIFLNMTAAGEVAKIMSVFLKIIAVIFVMTIVLLIVQFSIAGMVARKNPFRLLANMMPAYATALGTQSSAATIPVTLAQTLKNGVREDIAGFVVPLCATIHLSGSTMKIVACSMAIMVFTGMPFNIELYSGFIIMLGITMVAAPGVPGGAIMASLGILQSILGFNEEAQGLMIALYIAMDSFGTACNVTGDGAIATIMQGIVHKKEKRA